MYKINRVAIRQSTDVKFWDFTPEQQAEIKTKYDDTGKRVSFNVTVDELVETRESVWTTQADWKIFNDEYANNWIERNKYYIDNNIIALRTVV